MPTTTEKNSFQRARVPLRPGAGEPPGEPAPPSSPQDRPGLSQAQVEDAVARARLRRMVKRPDGERIPDEVIDELLAGTRTAEVNAGPDWPLDQMYRPL